MQDDRGVYSTAVGYTLTQDDKDSYILTVIADKDWLCSDMRAYPVVIDPPVIVNSSNGMTDTYINSVEYDTSFASLPYAFVGQHRTADLTHDISNAYWKVNRLPYIPGGNIITSQTDFCVFPNNLLTNGNFEASSQQPVGWTTAGNASVTAPSTEPVFDGGDALLMQLSQAQSTATAVQEVYLPTGSYTLSALTRIEQDSADEVNVWIDIIEETEGNDVARCIPLQKQNIGMALGITAPLSVSFEITESAYYEVRLCAEAIDLDAADTAAVLFDGVALSNGNAASVYNYSSVAEAALNGIWNQELSYDKAVSFLSNPQQAQTYILAGWGKAAHSIQNDISVFALQAEVCYADESNDLFVFLFHPHYDDWQYIASAFTTAQGKAVQEIIVSCIYNRNFGTAYFKDIALVRGEDRVVDYDYDSNGSLISAKDSKGKGREITYKENAKHLVDSVTVDGKASEQYSYSGNLLNRVSADTDGDGTDDTQTSYNYNTYGQVVGTTFSAASGTGDRICTASVYSTSGTSFGFKLSETDATSMTVEYEYYNGKLLKILYNNGDEGYYYDYDSYGRLRTVYPYFFGDTVDVFGPTVSYVYDSRGRLSELSTQSTVYGFTYDAFGRTTQITAGGRTLAEYEYRENNGKLLSVSYGNGYRIDYCYDMLDRIAAISCVRALNGGAVALATYTYNSEGQLICYDSHINAVRTVYEYNTGGRLLRETQFSTEDESIVGDSGVLSLLSSRYWLYHEDGRVAADHQYLPSDDCDRQYDYSYQYNEHDELISVTARLDGSSTPLFTYSISYDALKRVDDLELTSGSLTVTHTPYYYGGYRIVNGQNVYCTSMLSVGDTASVTYGNSETYWRSYDYYYDARRNITGIAIFEKDDDGYQFFSDFISYVYDEYGQLIREDNEALNRTYVYTYDNAGNITSKKEYAYTTATVISAQPLNTSHYTYGDASWGDLLTAYNGQSITYDTIGNPLTYMGKTLTWTDGRRLASVTNGSTTIASYTYDHDGMRVSKTVGSTRWNYIYSTDRLVRIEQEAEVGYAVYMDFLYAGSSLVGFRYINEAEALVGAYYYVFGPGGNVDAVVDSTGTLLVSYLYDAWGNFTAEYTADYYLSDAALAIAMNPFRYRSYFYDTETGWYYLSSRYYDPETCRFVNADNQISIGNDLMGSNLFAYCGNSPITRVDPTGHAWWHWAIGAAVVVVCAVAVVATAGGAAAGIAAVTAVGNGFAAATTASTVAAAAFIGSATYLGVSAMSAAATSSSVREFCDQGNWETVAGTVISAGVAGVSAYVLTRGSSTASNPSISRGSTGRTEPTDLREQLAMEQVKSNPQGIPLPIIMNDPRWPESEGWVKMQQIVPTSQGNINIHYVYNQIIEIFDDFKFKP